jgi:hypothetical protein
VGVTGIYNTLINKNNYSSIDNIICIINGIFHGISCGWQGRIHRCHEIKIELGMVLGELDL